MRGRHGSADAVEAAKNQVPLIICKPHRPMDKGRNGARYFRNPPQPHMCIQDFIEDTNEPCFINVLSWVKISTPRKPEDPIPLYGGMRVPHNSCAALSLSSHFGSKGQPVIFAVMANPEILRLSGKTAQDPSDRDALVELMIDFVEAMNPDVRFKRQFTVLRDRDLAGELKDIWLAVQAKRERERGENGKRDSEKMRENKDDTWHDEERQRTLPNVDQEARQNILFPAQRQEGEQFDAISLKDLLNQKEELSQRAEKVEVGVVEGQCYKAGEISSLSLTSIHPPSSSLPNEISSQHIGSINYGEESVYSLIRSHYEQDFNRTESNNISELHRSSLCSDQSFPEVLTSTNLSNASHIQKQAENNVIYPLFSAHVVNDSLSHLEVTSVGQPVEEINVSLKSVQHDQNHCALYQQKDENLSCQKSDQTRLYSSEYPTSCLTRISYDSLCHLPEDATSPGKTGKNPSVISPEHSLASAEEHIYAGYSSEGIFLNNKSQVPSLAGRSHEDLLPSLGDAAGMKFTVGSDHSTVAIP